MKCLKKKLKSETVFKLFLTFLVAKLFCRVYIFAQEKSHGIYRY